MKTMTLVTILLAAVTTNSAYSAQAIITDPDQSTEQRGAVQEASVLPVLAIVVAMWEGVGQLTCDVLMPLGAGLYGQEVNGDFPNNCLERIKVPSRLVPRLLGDSSNALGRSLNGVFGGLSKKTVTPPVTPNDPGQREPASESTVGR